MLKWLLKKNVDDLMEEGEYLQAMAAIHEELAKSPPPLRARPLREKLVQVLVHLGELPSAEQLLTELIDEYLKEHQVARAIALQKRLAELRGEESEAGVAALAAFVAPRQPPRPPQGDLIEAPADLNVDDVPAVVEVPPEQAALAATPLFGDFSQEELAAVIREMRLLLCEPGEVVMVEGEPTRSLFVLTQGVVRVYVRSRTGESVQVREIEGVAFFGEISIVSERPRTATITCKTRCELLVLSAHSLLEIARTHPRVERVLREFCERRAGSAEERAARAGEPPPRAGRSAR